MDDHLSNQSIIKKTCNVQDLSKLGALLHKTNSKVPLVQGTGSTSVDPQYH